MREANTKQSGAHVRGGVPRARGLATGGLLHVSPDNRMLQREVEFYPTSVHDDRACAVIAAELVACTLGVRVRPELVKPLSPLSPLVDAAHRLLEVLRAAAANLSTNAQATR